MLCEYTQVLEEQLYHFCARRRRISLLFSVALEVLSVIIDPVYPDGAEMALEMPLFFSFFFSHCGIRR